MGTIEDLRQQYEARVLREQQLADEKKQQAKLEHDQDVERWRLFRERTDRVGKYLVESGVRRLLADLHAYLPGGHLPDRSFTNDKGFPVSKRDNASSLDLFTWDHRSRFIGKSSFEVQVKYFAVETCPDGAIVFWNACEALPGYTQKPESFFGKIVEFFTGNPYQRIEPKSLLIPEAKWKSDKKSLADALDIAYQNPLQHKYLNIVIPKYQGIS